MTNINNNKLLLQRMLCLRYSSSPAAKNVSNFINPNSSGCTRTKGAAAVELAKKEPEVVLAHLIQPKPKLVFLQKKGSQIPNPNIISYNFPAADKHQINT